MGDNHRLNRVVMVLNICTNDYANFMFDITMSMQSIGIKTEALKVSPHEFGYDSQIEVGTRGEMIRAIQRAEIVQIFHSDLNLYNLTKSINPKALRIMYHTGTVYRQNPDRFNNAIDNETRIVMALGEFMTLGARKPRYIVGAMDTNKIKPRDNFMDGPGLRIFGHFPSNKINKGSQWISELMIKHRDVNFISNATLIPHSDHLKRIQSTDVLIELFSPSQGGKKYGSWGITCLEAAAMAKVVVTQNLSDNVYREYYGDHPLQLANTPQEFHEIIDGLRDCSDTELLKLQIETWKWVQNNHGYRATGKYIQDKIIN